MPNGGQCRDPAFARALDAVGGVRALERELGLKHPAVSRWRRVPQVHVLDVARLGGVPAEDLRPDLADWIYAEKARRRMALARSRYGVVRAAIAVKSEPCAIARNEEQVVDVFMALAAARFVAGERGMSLNVMMFDQGHRAGAARALAMSLAHVIGRARCTNVAALYGVSRQNVANAAERYLRARDGDDPDDIESGRVLERGRPRPAKTADEGLWALETRFEQLLEKGA